MMLRGLFTKKQVKEPFEARLGDEQPSGRLEPRSPTWLFVRNYAENEIAALREHNDKPLSADQTAAVRGQIKALRRLLELETGPGNRPKASADHTLGVAGEDY